MLFANHLAVSFRATTLATAYRALTVAQACTDRSAAQHTAAFCWSGADFVSAALLLLLIFSIAKDTIAQTQLIILITHT